jgi:membrane-associated phospholipid phosphatase
MLDFEFKIIEFIQQIRTPIVDEFFKFLNFFDTSYFYFILLPMIWFGYNRKLGIKLFFILMLSFIINEQLKQFFMLPRPCQIEPSVGVICFKSYSFPSNAAQSAILIPLVFINHFKNKWMIFTGLLFFFFLSLSRMYLGVHFLSDIIVGWIIGFLLFFVYLYFFPKIENQIVKKPIISFWIGQFLFLFLLFIPGFRKETFILLGVFLGLYLSFEFDISLKDSKKLNEFLIRSFLAILGVYILHFVSQVNTSFLIKSIVFYLMGFWISFLCPFIYKKIFLKN